MRNRESKKPTTTEEVLNKPILNKAIIEMEARIEASKHRLLLDLHDETKGSALGEKISPLREEGARSPFKNKFTDFGCY